MKSINKDKEITYRETTKYSDNYKITNIYPILTKEENEKKKEEILTKLYYEFTSNYNA
jgi:hypothetical protein